MNTPPLLLGATVLFWGWQTRLLPFAAALAILLEGSRFLKDVIPAVESEYLAQDLRGHAPVRLLLSGLISHAEADRPMHLNDVMQLAGFWGDLLSR